KVTDPMSRTARYTYDIQGRLDSVTDPAGGVTRYAFDAVHRIIGITDARGITYLTNEYDAENRVVRQTQADGGVWQFSYGTFNNGCPGTTTLKATLDGGGLLCFDASALQLTGGGDSGGQVGNAIFINDPNSLPPGYFVVPPLFMTTVTD